MPAMGDSVAEGTVLEWRKQEGDAVDADETLVEISTDKVDAEVPSPAAGTIVKIHAAEGETVAVGAVLAEISTNGVGAADAVEMPVSAESPPATPEEAVAGAVTEAEGVAAAQAATGDLIDIVTPTGGESVTEGTILEWSVKVGDAVKQGDTVVEISTDKVDMELPAPATGTITEILAQDGETVSVGQVIARMTAGAGAARTDPVAAAPSPRRRLPRTRPSTAPTTSPRWHVASPPSRAWTSRHFRAPPGAAGSPRPTCSRPRPTAATAPRPRPLRQPRRRSRPHEARRAPS